MSKALATKNVATVVLAAALIFGFAFSFATPVKADVISDLQAQVQALLAQIASLQGGSGSGSMSGAACHTFTRNHKSGESGGEVMWIQLFLNSMPDTMVASSGAGSKGNETSYFGPATKAAVIKFQNKYKADILTPVGLTSGTGNWGPSSRAKANMLCSGSTPTTPPTTTPGVGGNLMVGASAQPANSLAPKGTSRVPFTTFTLTNTGSAAVTVNSVTVQRTGLGQDAAFAGIVLIDESGMQLGSSRTLNSNHQANAGDAFTINPGQTKTITVAGNMAADLTNYVGQVVSLSVVGINTSATVSGTLPINGASHTLNNSLTIGTLTTALGSSDLNAPQTNQSIGETGKIGASVRLTAGSAEDVWVKSVRFNQSGSAGPTDLSNVVIVVDGTSYPTTVSADGKYYSAVFPGNGIQIAKGLNKEVIIKFDIAGGPNRTVNFDIYKGTDIYAVGGTYGYGISPSQTGTCSTTTSTSSEFVSSNATCTSGTPSTPYFSGSQFTISAGTATSYSRASEVAAQNITIAAPNQPLGGFAFDVKGEPIMVQSHTFYFNFGNSTDNGELLTSVRLVDKNGAVVAGPVDAQNVGGTAQKVTFSDTVTYPTGRNVYTLQGQLPSTISNGQTIVASTTPSTDWSNVTGQTTGDSISLSSLSSAVSANTMTVKTGAVVASVASAPAAQTVVSGVSGQTVAAMNLDATQSGEDVRFTSIKAYYTDNLTGGDVTNCFAYDGATRLNDTAVNPTTTATDYTFTLNTTLTVSKGTVKVVSFKCDIPAAVSAGSFSLGVNNTGGNATFSGTGVSSSNSITPSNSTAAVQTGNTMTIAGSGTLAVTLDASSPAYLVAAAGTSNVTLGALRFTGTNEAMNLDKVSLILSNGYASSSPANITQVTLWDGATQVGTAIFAGTRYATSTITGTVTVPSNGYKILTVKGNLANIGTGQATTTNGILIQVDYNGADATSTSAIGASSGTTISSAGPSTAATQKTSTAASGVRVFRSYPTVARLTPPTTTLVAQNGVELYRFTVSANASGDVGLREITVNIATSSVTTSNGTTSVGNLKIYAFTDSGMSQGVSGFISGLVSNTVTGSMLSGDQSMVIDQNSQTTLQVPAGQTYYFKVVGDVSQTAGTSGSAGSVTTKLSGDSTYHSLNNSPVSQAAAVVTSSAFVWSGNATTTSSTSHQDWTNGYGLPGLPAGGTDATTLSK